MPSLPRLQSWELFETIGRLTWSNTLVYCMLWQIEPSAGAHGRLGSTTHDIEVREHYM